MRTRGGNIKYRALRLDTGNFSWGSEGEEGVVGRGVMCECVSPPALATTRKTRLLDVVYNASNNELVRTKTLVKNCIVHIDATPFRQWSVSPCSSGASLHILCSLMIQVRAVLFPPYWT